MLASHSPSPPPPPPPTLPPPGPPEYGNDVIQEEEEEEETNQEEKEVEDFLVRYERNESSEGSHEAMPWYLNEGVGVVEPEDQTTEEPPAPPPRVESVYREKESPSHADHFLGGGRGGDSEAPPLPVLAHLPPVPPQLKQAGESLRLTEFNEEEALIKELNELEKMVSQYPPEERKIVEEDKDEISL